MEAGPGAAEAPGIPARPAEVDSARAIPNPTGPPVYSHGMGFTAWGRLYSLFPTGVGAAAPALAPTSADQLGTLGASPPVATAPVPVSPLGAAGATTGSDRKAPLPLWVREFWVLGAFVGTRPAAGGRAQSWAAGDRSVLTDDSFRALPRPASRGCAVAMVLGLLRRVGDCEVCGRSLRGRPIIKCQRCGRRLCDAVCVRLCHRAARLDSLTGNLNELARGCAARFCAQCEPIHVCARVEPQKVVGWRCPPEASEHSPEVPPPLPQLAVSTGLQRCSSGPPGGGRVVPLPWFPR